MHAPEVESEPASDDMFDVAARLAALTRTHRSLEAASPVVMAETEASVESEIETDTAVEAEVATFDVADLAVDADVPAIGVAEPESPAAVIEPEPAIDIAAAVVLADHDPREAHRPPWSPRPSPPASRRVCSGGSDPGRTSMPSSTPTSESTP